MAQPRARRWGLAALLALAAIALVLGLATRPAPPPREAASSAAAPDRSSLPRALLPRPGAAAPDEPPPPRAALRVFVTDAGLRPLAGARVRVFSADPREEREAFTDEEGAADVAALPAGAAELVAEAAGHATGRRVVDVPSEAPIRVALERAASLAVTVTDAAGRPIEAVELRYASPDRRARAEASTDAAGHASLRELAPGPGQLVAEPTEQLGRSEWLTLAPGEERQLTIVLDAGAAVTGSVLDPAGRPVEGASVSARSAAPPNGTLGFARSGPDGRFRLAGLTPGAVEIEAEADGLGVAVAPLVAPGDVTLRLPPTASVFGQLRGPDDAIPERANVNGVRVEEGRFRLDAIRPGPIELLFAADALATRRLSVTLAVGEARDLGTIVLAPGRTIAVRAVDAQGAPHAATIELRSEAGADTTSDRADEQGWLEFKELAAGRYVVAAYATGVGRARASVVLDDRDVRVVLTLDGGARVDGVVIGPDGEPASSGHVVLLAHDRGVEIGSSTLDAGGHFGIEDVSPGPGVALVELPSGSHLEPIDVPADGLTLRIDLRPSPRATTTVELRVLDAAGHPVERGAALLLPGAHGTPSDGPALLGLLATPDARPFDWRADDGRLQLPAIPPGAYTLLLLLDGREPDVGLLWAEPLDVPAEGPVRRVLRLPADLPALDLRTLRGSGP